MEMYTRSQVNHGPAADGSTRDDNFEWEIRRLVDFDEDEESSAMGSSCTTEEANQQQPTNLACQASHEQRRPPSQPEDLTDLAPTRNSLQQPDDTLADPGIASNHAQQARALSGEYAQHAGRARYAAAKRCRVRRRRRRSQ